MHRGVNYTNDLHKWCDTNSYIYLFRIFVNCGSETEAKLLKNWSQILTTGHNNRKNYVLSRKTSSIYRASGQKRRYLALIDCSFLWNNVEQNFCNYKECRYDVQYHALLHWNIFTQLSSLFKRKCCYMLLTQHGKNCRSGEYSYAQSAILCFKQSDSFVVMC